MSVAIKRIDTCSKPGRRVERLYLALQASTWPLCQPGGMFTYQRKIFIRSRKANYFRREDIVDDITFQAFSTYSKDRVARILLSFAIIFSKKHARAKKQ